MRTLFRAAAWLLVLVIVFVSLSPPAHRPVTGAGYAPEHFLIYFVTGVAFASGYVNRWCIVAAGLVVFAAAVELAQLFVPGRHARFSDFIIDAAAACLGTAASWITARASKLHRRS
jgi:VanZ family protein